MRPPQCHTHLHNQLRQSQHQANQDQQEQWPYEPLSSGWLSKPWARWLLTRRNTASSVNLVSYMHSVALFSCCMALFSCPVALFPSPIPQEVTETLTLILLLSHLLDLSQDESMFQMGHVAPGPSQVAAHAVSADIPKLPWPVRGDYINRATGSFWKLGGFP